MSQFCYTFDLLQNFRIINLSKMDHVSSRINSQWKCFFLIEHFDFVNDIFYPCEFPVHQKEEERLRASIRRESQQKRIRERAHQRGLSGGYLEGEAGAGGYDDDEDDAEVSIAAMKKQYKAGGSSMWRESGLGGTSMGRESGWIGTSMWRERGLGGTSMWRESGWIGTSMWRERGLRGTSMWRESGLAGFVRCHKKP